MFGADPVENLSGGVAVGEIAGAELAGRGAMINALRSLQREVEAKVPSSMPDTMQAFAIRGSFKDTFSRLFASHPPLAERIRALQNG